MCAQSVFYQNCRTMVELQAEDPDLGPVTEWLRNGQTPTYDELRSFSLTTRRLWNLVPMVRLLDGVLVFKPNNSSDIKLVVPCGLHSTPLHLHGGPLSHSTKAT